MNEEELLARWNAEKQSYAAWGSFVVSQVLDGLRMLDASIDTAVFIKIPPAPRLKRDDSLVGKAFHRNKGYADPYGEIEDKIGVRFVVLLTSDVLKLQHVIESSTVWSWSLDKDYEADRERRPLEFAYQSKHYVLKAREKLNVDGVSVEEGTPCEVQLRTLLQHAHSELTHDNIYKAQTGTTVSSSVYRTVAKSMALIEAVDDFFERALQQLGEATAQERAALSSLVHLYDKHIKLTPGSDLSNAMVIHAFRDSLNEDMHAAIEEMLREKPFIVEQIQSKYGANHGFRQPWILLAYLEVSRRPNQAEALWPLTPMELNPVFRGLGVRMRNG